MDIFPINLLLGGKYYYMDMSKLNYALKISHPKTLQTPGYPK